MKLFDYCWWSLKHLYWDIRHYFKFPNRWLANVCPRTAYKDKPVIITDVLYGAIVDYVEVEKCFESICWEHSYQHKKVKKFLVECYDWIKQQRPGMVKKIDDIIQNGSSSFSVTVQDKASYEARYPGLEKLEEELQQKDNFYLTNIVKYRDYLWT